MFKIHPQLLNDCHPLGMMGQHHLLLHKNASLHWFILVPETPHSNLLDADDHLINSVMQTAKKLNHYLVAQCGYPKTNIASIGNIVEQCHVHIVGRRRDDACWPQPVWGNLPDGKEYDDETIKKIKTELAQQCSLSIFNVA